MRRRLVCLGLAALLAGGAAPAALAAPPSQCGLTGFVRTSARPCPHGLATAPAPRAQLLGGIFGGVVSGAIHKALSVIVSWVSAGAGAALRFTVSLIGASTRPALGSTWFSATYWQVAALSAVLAVPFLFAAAIHAVVRSDLALLGRAAFGYLPLAMLGVSVAAPLTALVLSATDEMCGFVSRAGGHADTAFLTHAAEVITGSALIAQDPFIVFFAAILTVAATLALWLELIVRAAAVDVVVLMLPLFFAAMVWPARRVWAIRAVETLLALILAKFAIVAVLTLGGAALDNASSGLAALLTGATLVLLATLSPWALLRLLPLHEVAAAAAGGLSQGPRQAFSYGRDRYASLAGAFGSSDASSSEPEAGDPADMSHPDVGLAPSRPALVGSTGSLRRSGRADSGPIDEPGAETPAAYGPPAAGDLQRGDDPPGAAGPDPTAGETTVAPATVVPAAGADTGDPRLSEPSAPDARPPLPQPAEPTERAPLPEPGESTERGPLAEQFQPGIVETPIVFTDGRTERMTDGIWGLEEADGGAEPA